MKKTNFKKSNYNKLPGTLFDILISLAFICFLLFDIISGENRISDKTITGSFVVFGGIFLYSLCRLFSRKPQYTYVNVNVWKYRLFQTTNKWQFICLRSLISAEPIYIFIFILFATNLIQNDFSLFQIALIDASIFIIYMFPFGYMNYRIYASVNGNVQT